MVRQRYFALILSLVLMFGLPLQGCGGRRASVMVGAGTYSQSDISFEFFYRSLSPHGHWVNIGGHGPCWRPTGMNSSWRPYYTNGHWVYTEYGWTWISRYSWGGIAFHYGSWLYDPFYGWVWVPGYSWGPAWVTWMYTDSYIGWAPLPPAFRFRVGVVRQPIVAHHTHYVFVPTQRITEVDITKVRMPFERNVDIVRSAHPATTVTLDRNLVVDRGPDFRDVERVRRSPVRLEQVSPNERMKPRSPRLDGDQIEVASPEENTREGRRVIKDSNRQEREARTDQERQNRRERRIPTEPPGMPPGDGSGARDQRQIERQQRKQEEELRREDRKQQKQIEKQRKQEEKQRRNERKQRPPKRY